MVPGANWRTCGRNVLVGSLEIGENPPPSSTLPSSWIALGKSFKYKSEGRLVSRNTSSDIVRSLSDVWSHGCIAFGWLLGTGLPRQRWVRSRSNPSADVVNLNPCQLCVPARSRWEASLARRQASTPCFDPATRSRQRLVEAPGCEGEARWLSATVGMRAHNFER